MTDFNSLYEFTDTGLIAFKKVFNGELAEDAIDPQDNTFAVALKGTTPFQVDNFDTAGEMAARIISSLGQLDLANLLPNTGLWAWLTFVLRDHLFKRNQDGRRRVGDVHRWYPSDPKDYQKAQRHLVRMPTLLVHTLGSSADHLVCGTPMVGSEIREQLTSQQDMFTHNFQKAARRLYFDDATKKLKRGAGGKGAGSPRRLAKLRRQLDITWDLDELDSNKILAKLPKEFERFQLDKA